MRILHKTLYNRLGKLDFQTGLINVVKGERVMGLSIIDDFVEDLKKEIKKKPVKKPNFFFFNCFISINKKYVLEKSDKYISLSHFAIL